MRKHISLMPFIGLALSDGLYPGFRSNKGLHLHAHTTSVPALTEAEKDWIESLNSYRRKQLVTSFARGLTEHERKYVNSQLEEMVNNG